MSSSPLAPGWGALGTGFPKLDFPDRQHFVYIMRAALWVFVCAHFSREESDGLSQVPKEIEELKD